MPADPKPDDDEAAFLLAYDASRYALPSVTVDVCAFCVLDADLKVLLVKRDRPPHEGAWALPGTFVRVAAPATAASEVDLDESRVDEDLEEAARRALREKARMPDGPVGLRQLITVGPIDRDPRTRVITVVHMALLSPEVSAFVRAAGHEDRVRWVSFPNLESSGVTPLAFDHQSLLQDARLRLVQDLDKLAPFMAPATFTIGELRAVHEAARQQPVDPGNFRRRFLAWEREGRWVVVPGERVTGRRRAKVYAANEIGTPERDPRNTRG